MSKRVYRQVKNQAGEWELIEVGEPERGLPRLQIMGAKPHEPYRSPIDGTVVTSKRREREHMLRHGVVRPGDFGEKEGSGYFMRRKLERQAFLDGKDPTINRKRKEDIVETVRKLEQGMTPAKPRNPELPGE